MACFATPTQLPVMQQLAQTFAICDQWYSSLPGPTWPNRFFLHGASSSGLDDSPSSAQMAEWELPGEGFRYPKGSIYDALRAAGIPYRFYIDSTGAPLYRSLYSDDPQAGSALGAVAQVSSLSGVTLWTSIRLAPSRPTFRTPTPTRTHSSSLTTATSRAGPTQAAHLSTRWTMSTEVSTS